MAKMRRCSGLVEDDLQSFRRKGDLVLSNHAAARTFHLPHLATVAGALALSNNAALTQLGRIRAAAGDTAILSGLGFSEADQQRLWQALARNELQIVTTDHCQRRAPDGSASRLHKKISTGRRWSPLWHRHLNPNPNRS